MQWKSNRRRLFDRNTQTPPGFTLIELLVVIAVISILMTILVPALGKAREQARAAKCAMNLKSIGLGMGNYLSEYDRFPPSYAYPVGDEGIFRGPQDPAHANGYLHWSWFLYSRGGTTSPKAFECPAVPNGGAPRTNPGPLPGDWEADQVDQNGNSGPNGLTDKQAPRMAYTANAAIMPRNKFTNALSGGQRRNILVRCTNIEFAGDTIMATEFSRNWKALAVPSGGGYLSKSHRPVNPFMHLGTGYAGNAAYAAPPNTPGFVCGDPSAPCYGIKPYDEVLQGSDLLDGGCGHPLNAVGRHHPGSSQDRNLGGTANFVYVDGHVENAHVLDTILKRQWGSLFYSITGANEVRYIIK